ncbi:vancomycin high temperature exclusion protein [Cellulomonas sp. PhB150]|uniref:SanA/YdcF family protein n=1 Tax=Cellulomonas sp. PhB150 TaxID=2485188 RepID=UPI000F48E0BA|nr:ElyC/SanA/YdcF family protein [Cellulomonas sp. PhB150]ROS31814.1 vancomycin permeability regulator SanA [Cellulomonas sp. PhB150]
MSDDAAPTTVSERLDDAEPGRARSRRRRVLAVVLVLGVLLVLALPLLVVQGVGRAHERSLADVPDTPVALVLGAGLHPDGTPSTYLARRLDAARSLYERGAVQVILVSGDNGTAQHDEPTAMRDYLVDHGIPSDKIVLDYAGFDTHDSCVRAHQVFGVDEAVVVTQDYHLPRALFSCAAAGMDVTGVGVSAASVTPKQALVWRLREVPASYKAAWDALVGRGPVYGGHETGVQDALDQG